MGAAEAKANPSLFASYKFIQKKSSAAFGDLTIMQDLKTKQLVAIREQVFQSMKDYEQENSKLSKQAQFLHPNIIQLRQVNSFCEKQFCSSVYKILHAIEYIPTDVESDLKQRKQPYTEHDLMALLKDVSSAMQFLQIKGMTHGDLRLSTIFTQSNGPNKKQEDKELKDIYQVFPFYESHFENYKRIKNSSTMMSKGLLKSLNPEIRDIFEALCESETIMSSTYNEGIEVKYTTQSNKNHYVDIGEVIISKSDINESITQIDIKKNDISENYQDTEKDTSNEIILNPKRNDKIDLSQKRKIIFDKTNILE